MNILKKAMTRLLTRREALKVSGLGLTLGGAAMAAGGLHVAMAAPASYPPGGGLTDKNSYLTRLKPCVPAKETLAEDEMRITFLGTWYNPRIAQACNSVFVEVGWDKIKKAPLDQFVFDCGSGVTAKYFAMGISPYRMNKIFLTHIHGDHMSDLMHIYCFGPSMDRKSPLYVWGPGRSELIWTSPPCPPDSVNTTTYGPYDDGTSDYCNHLREAARWHTESFSFQTTAVIDDEFKSPEWFCPDATPYFTNWKDKKDGYDLVPFELKWQEEGNVAYKNIETGVTVTHFPAVHAREGAISYKLEYQPPKGGVKPLSMIFTGDTKPNNYVVRQANNGVDVLIHEIASPPEVWVEKFTGLQPGDIGYERTLEDMQNVQDSSHTPQMMFGCIMSKLDTPPRLAVGTHFAATDEVIRYALEDIRVNYPTGEVAIATDFMVINVTKKSIRQRRAVVSDYVWAPPLNPIVGLPIYDTPKYWKYDGDQRVGDPYAQLDPDADVIESSAC